MTERFGQNVDRVIQVIGRYEMQLAEELRQKEEYLDLVEDHTTTDVLVEYIQDFVDSVSGVMSGTPPEKWNALLDKFTIEDEYDLSKRAGIPLWPTQDFGGIENHRVTYKFFLAVIVLFFAQIRYL